jgi:voltage-gated potassium channel
MAVVSRAAKRTEVSANPLLRTSAIERQRRGALWVFGRATTALALVLGLLSLGTVGFHVLEGWSWFRSFYGTLMTVTTIGAEPENQLSYPGEVFNVLMMIIGFGVVGFIMAMIAQGVIEFELGTFFGRRRMEKEIARIQDHIIICGAGRVGRRLAVEVAARKIPLLIIEQDPAKAQWAVEQNLPVIIGDATHEAVLRQARIEHARGLASAVTSDAQNVYIVLTARGMAPKLPIVTRASEEHAESKLVKAGADTVISPYTYAGVRMARTLTRPNVQRFIDVALSSLNDGDLDLQIEEVRVANTSKLAGSTLAESDLRHRLGVIILAIRSEAQGLDFNPKADRKIAPGDFLIAMGDSQKLKSLESLAGV